jgi:type II secretory pathway pseudopilin PulG
LKPWINQAEEFEVMKTPKMNKRSGFTMVEIALAMMVMTVGVLGIFALFPVGLNSSRDAKTDTQMAMLAQAVFDDFRDWSARNWVGDQPPNWTSYNFKLHENVSNASAIRPIGQSGNLQGGTVLVRQVGTDGAEGVPICHCNMEVVTISPELVGVQLIMYPGRQLPNEEQGITVRALQFYTVVAKRSLESI